MILCRYVLKGFSKEGRDLTDAETREFLKAADKDGDGKIGIDGERKLLRKYFIIKEKVETGVEGDSNSLTCISAAKEKL